MPEDEEWRLNSVLWGICLGAIAAIAGLVGWWMGRLDFPEVLLAAAGGFFLGAIGKMIHTLFSPADKPRQKEPVLKKEIETDTEAKVPKVYEGDVAMLSFQNQSQFNTGEGLVFDVFERPHLDQMSQHLATVYLIVPTRGLGEESQQPLTAFGVVVDEMISPYESCEILVFSGSRGEAGILKSLYPGYESQRRILGHHGSVAAIGTSTLQVEIWIPEEPEYDEVTREFKKLVMKITVSRKVRVTA